VALVLLTTLAVRVATALRTPVINPDLVRFIELAQRLEANPLAAVRGEAYHPLHAALGALLHGVFVAHIVADQRLAWIISLQIVGILSAVAVVWLIIQLARHFGAPWWAACAAGLLFAVGRRTSGFGADGLSDMLFLALFAGALLVAVRTRLHWRPWSWLLAGVLAGLSYLTRPEGVAAVIIVGIAVVLHTARFRPRRWPELVRRWHVPRRSFCWNDAAKSLATLLLGFLLIGLPYMVAIGRFTAKKHLWDAAAPLLQAPVMVAAQLPAPLHEGLGSLFDPAAWQAIGMELWETFGFGPCLVVLLAMAFKPRLWGRRHWQPLVLVWVLIWVGVMVWLLDRAGYLAGRHTLPLQVALHCLFALALPIWARPVQWLLQRQKAVRTAATDAWPRVAVAGALTLGCLPGMIKLIDTPYADKLYLVTAGEYLQSHARPGTLLAGRDLCLSLAYQIGFPAAYWAGPEDDPRGGSLTNTVDGRPVIAMVVYERDSTPEPPETIGPYQRWGPAFESSGSMHGDVLLLYARAGSPVGQRGPEEEHDGGAAARQAGP
jgi:hypothetical protein